MSGTAELGFLLDFLGPNLTDDERAVVARLRNCVPAEDCRWLPRRGWLWVAERHAEAVRSVLTGREHMDKASRERLVQPSLFGEPVS